MLLEKLSYNQSLYFEIVSVIFYVGGCQLCQLMIVNIQNKLGLFTSQELFTSKKKIKKNFDFLYNLNAAQLMYRLNLYNVFGFRG
jgi:hypothetical protein